MNKENHAPSAKLWIEYKPGGWKLVSDMATFRPSGRSITEPITMEIAYDDVKKLLSHIADSVTSSTSSAIVQVISPPPSIGKFGTAAEV